MYVTVVAKFILQEFDVHRLQHPLPPLVEQVTAYIRNDNRNNNGEDMLILKIIPHKLVEQASVVGKAYEPVVLVTDASQHIIQVNGHA